ncbi:MAG: thiosulfohydrolase SoxB [Gammaproteobacteria bacterium]|nr:thiosulfohydrolase SoxB [Gammaproteobacteria bacterium]
MLSRREFLQLLQALSVAGMASACTGTKKASLGRDIGRNLSPQELYDNPAPPADVRLIHFTDVHAQLLPSHFREPETSFPYRSQSGADLWQPGGDLSSRMQVEKGSLMAHALTSDGFDEFALKYGKTGGFSHMLTLIERLRLEAGAGNSLLLDGGDSWQGSAGSLWNKGGDMVGASNLMGVDCMTAHWEFTYGAEQFVDNINNFNGSFLAQNIFLNEKAHFENRLLEPDADNRVFTPWKLYELGGHPVAVIGQAYPYTPIAHPGNFTPQWTFSIAERELFMLVDKIRRLHPGAAIVLLSHNGLGVDLRLAERVNGIDLILGGHTHDPVYGAIAVSNRGGQTLVTNAGCAGKFINVCDLKFSRRGLRAIETRLMPVFSHYLPAHTKMQTYIDDVRSRYDSKLSQKIGEFPFTLYRRGHFGGTVDELIMQALAVQNDAPICFSPGFRWGNAVPAGTATTVEDIYSWTAISYARSYRRQMTGQEIWRYLEDVADNLLNRSAFLQQGGDMVRTRGLSYRLSTRNIRGYRINDLRLSSGELVDANKTYTVAGWASASMPRKNLRADMPGLLERWLLDSRYSINEPIPYQPLID